MAVYRATRFSGACLVGVSFLPLAVAGIGLWAAGFHILFVISALMGVLFQLNGLWIHASRIIVDESGFWSTPGWLGFRVGWDDVEYWFVIRDIDNDLWAQFRVRGRRFAVQIKQETVAQPGFNDFLEEVRSHVRTKETEPKPWAFGD